MSASIPHTVASSGLPVHVPPVLALAPLGPDGLFLGPQCGRVSSHAGVSPSAHSVRSLGSVPILASGALLSRALLASAGAGAVAAVCCVFVCGRAGWGDFWEVVAPSLTAATDSCLPPSAGGRAGSCEGRSPNLESSASSAAWVTLPTRGQRSSQT